MPRISQCMRYIPAPNHTPPPNPISPTVLRSPTHRLLACAAHAEHRSHPPSRGGVTHSPRTRTDVLPAAAMTTPTAEGGRGALSGASKSLREERAHKKARRRLGAAAQTCEWQGPAREWRGAAREWRGAAREWRGAACEWRRPSLEIVHAHTHEVRTHIHPRIFKRIQTCITAQP